MPKAKISKAERIRIEHEAFLRSHGIDPSKRPRVKPTTQSPLVAAGAKRTVKLIEPSSNVPGNGTRADLQMRAERGQESKETVDAINALKSRVAPAYNKGPLMLVSNPEDLKTNMRRPGGI